MSSSNDVSSSEEESQHQKKSEDEDKSFEWHGNGAGVKGALASNPFMDTMVSTMQEVMMRAMKGPILDPVPQHRDDFQRPTAKKRQKIIVQEDGEIDVNSPGKNFWDSNVRTWVPRILDLSIVKFEKQKPDAVMKLRKMLDSMVVYEGGELDESGFANAIKRFMKTERFRLKGQFLAGRKECPPNVEPDQWEKLKHYWTSTSTMEKAAAMATARSRVKNYANMGRKGKAAKSETMDIPQTSSAVTNKREHDAPGTGMSSSVDRVAKLEEKYTMMEHKVDSMEGKVSELLATQKTMCDLLTKLGAKFDITNVKKSPTTCSDSIGNDPYEFVTIKVKHTGEKGGIEVEKNGESEMEKEKGGVEVEKEKCETEFEKEKGGTEIEQEKQGVAEQGKMISEEDEDNEVIEENEKMRTKGKKNMVEEVNESQVSKHDKEDEPIKKKRKAAEVRKDVQRPKKKILAEDSNTGKFQKGVLVDLLNPKNKRQKGAWGRVSGIAGDKWHGGIIPQSWFRVDIGGVYNNIDLMFANEPADQFKLQDACGGNVIWEEKSMKLKQEN